MGPALLAIEYLPLAHDTEPQRFRYTTRIGCGLEVRGEGETRWQRRLEDGSASSALKFASAEPVSLIREGSGYWKYIPTADGVRFLTWYDYRTRFGTAGAVFDRLVFRPLMGWATAWSFDRLRLWLEERRGPGSRRCGRRSSISSRASRSPSIFAYQGLVPKLLAGTSTRSPCSEDAGVPPDAVSVAVTASGCASWPSQRRCCVRVAPPLAGRWCPWR